MKLNTLKRTIAVSGLGLAVLFGTSQIVDAQRNNQDRRQQQKIDKQQRKERDRQFKAEDRRIRSDQRREQTRIRNMPSRNVPVKTNRYRVLRDGNYYQTDNRGANLLRQAVNAGYQEGYRAGRNDRYSRRSSNYNNNSVYNRGNYGYQSYVNSSQYQYYFRQGFQRGYEDGFNSRYEYGTNNNGSLNILGNILQTILNIEQY